MDDTTFTGYAADRPSVMTGSKFNGDYTFEAI